jgi:transposase-like protein
MLSIGKLAAGQERYYEQRVAKGLDDYFTGRGESPGRWMGRGAADLRLRGSGPRCSRVRSMLCSASEFVSEIPVFFTPCRLTRNLSGLGVRRMSGERCLNHRIPRPAGGRSGCSAQEKYQIYQQLLTGEVSQRQAAERWGIDPTTIMRIRRVGREGALGALAQSRPGRRDGRGEDPELVAARLEIARLEETVKEQAIELVALRGKSRSGW